MALSICKYTSCDILFEIFADVNQCCNILFKSFADVYQCDFKNYVIAERVF